MNNLSSKQKISLLKDVLVNKNSNDLIRKKYNCSDNDINDLISDDEEYEDDSDHVRDSDYHDREDLLGFYHENPQYENENE